MGFYVSRRGGRSKIHLEHVKGLAEVTKDGTVQFIHESVRDYFLKEKGQERLWPDLVGNFQGLSHHQLVQCCQNYLKFCISQDPFLASMMGVSTEDVRSAAGKFPFLEYAIRDGIFHADAAIGFGIKQIELIENFSFRHWISFRVAFCEAFEKDSFSLNKLHTTLHVFASENLGNLVHFECEKDRERGIQREDYGEPLAFAIHHRNEKAIRALLTPSEGLRPENQQLFLSDERHEAVIRLFMSNGRSVYDLLTAAEHGEVDVVVALLRTKKMRVERAEGRGRTALWWATSTDTRLPCGCYSGPVDWM
jgi:hypothetical protein